MTVRIQPDPYRYIAPTPETARKHKAIRDAATEAALLPLQVDEVRPLQALYAHISHRLRSLHEAIIEHAPASADRSAAERCCRLAWMLASEAVTTANVHGDIGEGRRLMSLAHDQIMLARMQACAAIALASA